MICTIAIAATFIVGASVGAIAMAIVIGGKKADEAGE